MDLRFAYLHGFASSPLSLKGQALAEAFEARGMKFELPDLNRPSFAELSHGAALEAIDAMDAVGSESGAAGARWCFVGSSLGGWLAARWAELHPERVHRLLLLCPGFHLAERWPVILGPDAMVRWRDQGALEMEDAAGVPTAVHYGFFEESQRQPPRPIVPCETRIIHGARDEIVPIESSRAYSAEIPRVSLLELDDDHSLAASVDRVCAEALGFFGLAR